MVFQDGVAGRCIWLMLLGFACLFLSTFRARTSEAGDIDSATFYRKFSKNDFLTKTDLAILPEDVRRYLYGRLDWDKHGYSGFSRNVGGLRYLFSVGRPGALGYTFHAAVIDAGGLFRPNRSAARGWSKLFLPYLQTGGRLTSRDQHSQHAWSNELEAIQSTECSDLIGRQRFHCVRYFHKVYVNEYRLIAMKYCGVYRGNSEEVCVTAWENGRWFDLGLSYGLKP